MKKELLSRQWVFLSQAKTNDGVDLDQIRFQALKSYYESKGWEWRAQHRVCDLGAAPAEVKSILSEVGAIRFCDSLSSLLQSMDYKLSQFMNTILRVEAVIAQNGDPTNINPYSLLSLGLQRVLLNCGEKIDLFSPALIVGSGLAARVVLSTLAKAGLKEFKIVAREESKVREMSDVFSKIFLNIKLEFVPFAQVTLLPGTNTILVNTTPSDGNEVIGNLYYFNFLKPDSLVWDLCLHPFNTPLVEESRLIGAHAVDGLEIAVHVEAAWIELLEGREIDTSALRRIFESML